MLSKLSRENLVAYLILEVAYLEGKINQNILASLHGKVTLSIIQCPGGGTGGGRGRRENSC